MKIKLQNLLTTSDVSKQLGIKISTLNQWASRRTGPSFIKLSRHRMYDPADIENFIKTKKVKTIDQSE